MCVAGEVFGTPRLAFWKPSGSAFGSGLRFLVLFLPIESHSVVLARPGGPRCLAAFKRGPPGLRGPRILRCIARQSVSIPHAHDVDQTDSRLAAITLVFV